MKLPTQLHKIERKHKIETLASLRLILKMLSRGLYEPHKATEQPRTVTACEAVHMAAKTKNVAARAAAWERTSTDCGRGSFSVQQE